MDQNNPARFLDTAYNAYKSNPGATNQVLQAAAQGAPVGLRGLAAAAAQQSQQQAQQAMAALQQQGPQPNVIQKLATQGIMSQMDTGLPIAQPMPEEAPQMMATGGLVAFADGGSVLPPDVIEAIQSHFAEGGAVHGYAEGETVLGDIIRDLKWRQLQGVANEEELARLSDLIRRQHLSASMIEGLSEAAAPKPDIGLTGPSPSRVLEESDRLGEIIRRERAARPMLEGLERGAGYQPSFKPEPTLSMVEKLEKGAVPYESTARAPVSEGMEKLAQAAEYSPEAVKKAAWTGGEGFGGFGKLGELASKAPRYVKGAATMAMDFPMADVLLTAANQSSKISSGAAKMLAKKLAESETGKALDEKAADLSSLLSLGLTDKITQRVGESSIGKALRSETGAEDILSGLAALRGEGWFPSFAAGGDVRGYANGAEILQQLVGPQRSLGERALGGLLDLFSTPDEPNRAITREELEARQESKRPDAEGYGKEGEAFKGAGLDISESPAPTPKPEVHPEGKKVDPAFKKVALDTSSTATGTPAGASSLTAGESMGVPQTKSGLEALDPFAARDLIAELRGRKTMTPALSKELEDLRGSARTSTILQSLLGGLGAGLSSPYGGRFALGKAALGSLAGYQKGIDAEDELGRSAFNILKGYEDAPAEEQAKAADELMLLQKAKMEEATKERVAAARAASGLSFEERAALKGIPSPMNPYQQQMLLNVATDNAAKEIARQDEARGKSIPKKSPLSDQEKEAIYRSEFARIGLPYQGTGGLGGGGLGGGPLGGQTTSTSSPVFITRPK